MAVKVNVSQRDLSNASQCDLVNVNVTLAMEVSQSYPGNGSESV